MLRLPSSSSILQENIDISYVIQMGLPSLYSHFLHILLIIMRIGYELLFQCSGKVIKRNSIAFRNLFCFMTVISTIQSVQATVHHGVLTHIIIMIDSHKNRDPTTTGNEKKKTRTSTSNFIHLKSLSFYFSSLRIQTFCSKISSYENNEQLFNHAGKYRHSIK